MNMSVAAAAFASATLAVLTPARAIGQEISDEWTFAAALYAWLPDINGNTTFGPDGGTASASTSAPATLN
jgi:branched-subunit amino acid aminotransferase/4-amino-4-deoxychorismate lyase